MLLPLAAEPFTPATDRDMLPYGPCSATARSALCVLDENWPFAYLQVYADATVEHDPTPVVDVMMAVGARMSGEPPGDEARTFVAAWLAAAGSHSDGDTSPWERCSAPIRSLGSPSSGGRSSRRRGRAPAPGP